MSKKKGSAITRRKFLKGLGAGAALFSGIYIIPRRLFAEQKTEAVTSASEQPPHDKQYEIKHLNHDILRERFNAPVAVYRCERPAEAAYNVLKTLKPALKADRILVKPNLASSYEDFQSGVANGDIWSLVTRPEFVEGIINYLKEQGIKPERIVVAEGTGSRRRDDMNVYFKSLGYSSLSEKMGFTLLSLNGEDVYEVKIEKALRLDRALVTKPVFDYLKDGVVINAPKLKMHNYAVCTVAMKNLLGTLHIDQRHMMHIELDNGISEAYRSRSRMKREDYVDSIDKFSERLCDLAALAPDISVVDGVTAGEGCGIALFQRWRGQQGDRMQWSVPAHVAFAGTNPINVDAVATNFMGYPAMTSAIEGLSELKTLPWLEYAQKNRYGKANPEEVKLLGIKELPVFEKKFRLYRMVRLEGDPSRQRSVPAR